jgi:ComEC/Rec2-related protein
MAPVRAPLFAVSLAFATGCVLGLDAWMSLRAALIIVAVAGATWLMLRRNERASLVVFVVVVIAAGQAHTLLLANSIPPEDVRRLPDEKALDTTQWRGTIIDEPLSQLTPHASRRAQDRTAFTLNLEAWRPTSGRYFNAPFDDPWQPATGRIRCTIVGPTDNLRLGDEVEFAAGLAPLPPARVQGEYDARDMAALHDIHAEVTVPAANWRRIAIGGGDAWQRLSYAARDWAYAQLQVGLEDDPRMADFLAGMLIGYRQQIPADIEQDFRRTGTIHVFAVSGQNIAEMVVVVLVLLQILGLVRWRSAWVVAPVVLVYCLLTGSPASAVRATVMALAVLAAWRFGRPMNALNCWAIALLAMLAWDPRVLLDPGAELSFALVLALILIAPPIARRLGRPVAPDPFLPQRLFTAPQSWEHGLWRSATMLLATGIAAVIVTEPITAVVFHQVTPISIVANLAAVPLAGVITGVGTLSIALAAVCPPLTALLNNANWLLAHILIAVVGWLAHQPGAMINVPDLLALRSDRPSLIVAPLPGTACLLVRTPRENWLINSGRENPGPSAVWHLLQFYGVNRLDGLVVAEVSTPDNSGALAIARDFHPRRLVLPVLRTKSPLEKDVPEMMAGTRLELWRAGTELDLGGIEAGVLSPSVEDDPHHADDRALAILLSGCGDTLLWAGRLGADLQRQILAATPGLHADVLVMSPETAPDAGWLAALHVREWLQIPPRDPRLNVVNEIEVPAGCRVWRLDQTGAVDLHFRPGMILLSPWLAEPSPLPVPAVSSDSEGD